MDLNVIVSINMQQEEAVFRGYINQQLTMILEILGKTDQFSTTGLKPVIDKSYEKAQKIEQITADGFEENGKEESTNEKSTMLTSMP